MTTLTRTIFTRSTFTETAAATIDRFANQAASVTLQGHQVRGTLRVADQTITLDIDPGCDYFGTTQQVLFSPEMNNSTPMVLQQVIMYEQVA